MKRVILFLSCFAISLACLAQEQLPAFGKSIGRWQNFGPESMKANKAGGMDYIEVTMNNVINKEPATAHVRAAELKAQIDEAGLKVWSVHMPYSRVWDISVLDDAKRKETLAFFKDMMKVASVFGAEYYVLHPSAEPISPFERPERLANSHESIGELAKTAKELGVTLCVENLPRTCLGRNGEEMMKLIDGYEDVGLCFDTNHLLFQEHADYLKAIAKGKIKTVHLSDYDFKDERHWVPGRGLVGWPEVWTGIRENGYEGIMMFETYGEPAELAAAREVLLGTREADERPLADSLVIADAKWETVQLEKGAVAMYAQLPMFYSTQSISVIKYPAKKFRSEILHRPAEQQGTVDRLAAEAGASVAVNACYFNTRKLIPTVYFRVGDEVYSHTQPNEVFRVDGVVAFKDKRGRKIMIAPSDTTQYEQVAGHCHSVLASGPVLILDDEIVVPRLMGDSRDGANLAALAEENKAKVKVRTNYSSADFFDKRHPRAVIGFDDEGYIYYVVIDGRFKGQADGTSIYETAQICKWLGMTDAINLDGGGSSTIWSEQTGIINYPYDNKVFDHNGARKIPNLIVAY